MACAAWLCKHYVAAEVDGATYLSIKRRGHALILGLTLPPDIDGSLFSEYVRIFKWSRITKAVRIDFQSEVDVTLLSLIEQASMNASNGVRGKRHYGISLRELLDAGLLHPGESLVLATSTKALTTATLTPNGTIWWQERTYETPSHPDFAALMGRQSLNGWTSWFVERPDGRRSLADIRSMLRSVTDQVG